MGECQVTFGAQSDKNWGDDNFSQQKRRLPQASIFLAPFALLSGAKHLLSAERIVVVA